MSKTYLLNTPILTEYGDFKYTQLLGTDEAKKALGEGWVSAIGHASTAQYLGDLLGCSVPANRIEVRMQPGDRAVVFRLTRRIPEGQVLDRDQLESLDYQLGLLERVDGLEKHGSTQVSAFISYSRDNWYIAERIATDLKRCGIDAWWDQERLRGDESSWRDVLQREIEARDWFVLLVSPESEKSDNVKKEHDRARELGKNVFHAHVGGLPEKLNEETSTPHLTPFTRLSYKRAFSQMVEKLDPQAANRISTSMIADDPLVGLSRKDLTDLGRLEHFGGEPYRVLPAFVSGYTRTDLILREESLTTAAQDRRLPERIAVVLLCSGSVFNNTLNLVSAHQRQLGEPSPFILRLQGRTRLDAEGEKIELDPERPWIWEDTMQAALKILEHPDIDGRGIDLYFQCPSVLAFAVARRLRQAPLKDHRLFHYHKNSYSQVY